jgi:ribosome-binding factor A
MTRHSDHRSTGRREAGGRAPGHRAAQVASLLQRIVQGEIQRGIADPRVRGLVTVLGVDLSQDLEDATVRVSVLPGELGPPPPTSAARCRKGRACATSRACASSSTNR